MNGSVIVICPGRQIHDIYTMNILPHTWLVKLLAGHYSSVRNFVWFSSADKCSVVWGLMDK